MSAGPPGAGFTHRRRAAAAAAVAAAVLIAGCGVTGGAVPANAPAAAGTDRDADSFEGTLVTPPVPVPDLTLRDTEGRKFALNARPAGEVLVVLFGYTHCPDLCPTTVADLAAARRDLPPDIRGRVTVAFITEDPERDSPAVLRTWLDQFGPGLVGLRGGGQRTAQALRDLYLTDTKKVSSPSAPVVHPDDGHHHPGDYGLEHAGQVYVFGPAGQTVLYTGGYTSSQYAHDLHLLAASDGGGQDTPD